MREGGARLADVVKRPEVEIAWVTERVARAIGDVPLPLVERVVNDIRYEGYVLRQHAEVRRQSEYDSVSIPESLDPREIRGLRNEAVETLARFRPRTLGQASRLAGISPADVTVVAMWVRRIQRT